MTSLPTTDIGLIGVGEIASALVEGLCTGPEPRPSVWLSPRGAAASTALAQRFPGCRVGADNQEVADRAGILFITLRPDSFAPTLQDLRVAPATLVLSAVAGLELPELRELIGPGREIVRAIPLPAVRRREGVTAIHPGHPVAAALFDSLGGSFEVTDEGAFAAFSAATGTISTHLAFLVAIANWLARHGVEPEAADRYLRGLYAGVGRGLGDGTLAELAANHETPGGLNEQLRLAWFNDGTASNLEDSLDRLLERVTRSS